MRIILAETLNEQKELILNGSGELTYRERDSGYSLLFHVLKFVQDLGLEKELSGVYGNKLGNNWK